MLWVLVVAPPFLGALFWGSAPIPNATALLGVLVAIWVYTLAVGGAIHLAITWSHRGRYVHSARVGVRVVVDIVVVALVVAVATGALLPILRVVTVESHIHPVLIGVRGLVIGCAYVAVGRALARLRARAVAEALRADAAQRAALEARLLALQARTNPHFLFNTLNAVASLIATDPARAEEIVEQLGSLFRYALEGSSLRTVPLQVELDAVRDYLSIERARFGDRLTAEVSMDAAVGAIDVPPLVVQPLVENAIVHGLATRAGPGRVWVRAALTESGVEIVVEDDGLGPGNSPKSGSGTALHGIRDRLALIFGDGARLETGERDGGGFRAVLRIPRAALTP